MKRGNNMNRCEECGALILNPKLTVVLNPETGGWSFVLQCLNCLTRFHVKVLRGELVRVEKGEKK